MTETPSSVWEYVDTLNHHEIVYMYNSIEPTKKKEPTDFLSLRSRGKGQLTNVRVSETKEREFQSGVSLSFSYASPFFLLVPIVLSSL